MLFVMSLGGLFMDRQIGLLENFFCLMSFEKYN